MFLFLIVPPVSEVSLSKEDEKDIEEGNKEEKDSVLPSCSNGHDGPSTSKDCQMEAMVRNRSI